MFSDIAAMQALDFICGNVDRHAGNFFLRFDPPAGPDGNLSPDAKLVGVSLIDDDLSFSHATAENKEGNPKFVDPRDMGVIGQNYYNAMKSMTKEQMQFALADCGLSQEEIDMAWDCKVTLQNQIEEDRKYFEGKQPGVVETGKIRVVPEKEWDQYSIKDLAKTAELKTNKFHLILRTPKSIISIQNSSKLIAMKEALHNTALGIEPKPEAAPQQKKKVPVGKVIGNGIAHEADPLNVAREETIRLVVPDVLKIKPVGDYMSQRFPMSYQADEGEKKAFFTPKIEQSTAFRVNKMFENTISDA